jgi:hypothetical protein
MKGYHLPAFAALQVEPYGLGAFHDIPEVIAFPVFFQRRMFLQAEIGRGLIAFKTILRDEKPSLDIYHGPMMLAIIFSHRHLLVNDGIVIVPGYPNQI